MAPRKPNELDKPDAVATRRDDADGRAMPAERLARDLRKREWLLEVTERQRLYSRAASALERRASLSRDEFLDQYYAPARPVILTGEMAGWPALARWTPWYLAEVVGRRPIEFQGDRDSEPGFEMFKDAHRRSEPFDAFIARITQPGARNDSYVTAYNASRNAEALAPLWRDLGRLEKFLTPTPGDRDGMMWIGPAGTVTPLHHDLTNNFIAQVTGRKRVRLLPASEVGRLYNHRHVFSEISDLEDPAVDGTLYPRIDGARVYGIELGPGEILFIPIGWWHQVKALDFSVSLTYTNFLWPNDASSTYPQD